MGYSTKLPVASGAEERRTFPSCTREEPVTGHRRTASRSGAMLGNGVRPFEIPGAPCHGKHLRGAVFQGYRAAPIHRQFRRSVWILVGVGQVQQRVRFGRKERASERNELKVAQHPQVAPTGRSFPGRRRQRRLRCPVGRGRFRCAAVHRCFPYRVGQCKEIIGIRFRRSRRKGEPYNFPPEGNREFFGVGGAQIIGVRLGIGGQRPQDSGRIGIHVCQRCYSSALAR